LATIAGLEGTGLGCTGGRCDSKGRKCSINSEMRLYAKARDCLGCQNEWARGSARIVGSAPLDWGSGGLIQGGEWKKKNGGDRRTHGGEGDDLESGMGERPFSGQDGVATQ